MNGFINVNGVQLETRQTGVAVSGKPALVLLHEGLGCVALWRDFPEKLNRATGLRVISFSREGYGQSDPCRLPRPVSYMHDEGKRVLPAVIDALGLEKVILVGHSDGASIATIYAGSSPGIMPRGLVLMAPHFFVEDVAIKSIEAARKAYDTTPLRARLEKYHGANVDCAFLGWNGAWLDPAFRDWDIRADLQRTPCPILAIQGEDDEYGTLAQIDTIGQMAPGPLTRCILPNCRHAPQSDQPGETLAAITAFALNL